MYQHILKIFMKKLQFQILINQKLGFDICMFKELKIIYLSLILISSISFFFKF